jgi:hypothetical protein
MKLPAHLPALLFDLVRASTVAVFAIGLAHAAESAPLSSGVMSEVDLRVTGQPRVAALRRVWQDRLSVSEPQWQPDAQSKTLPAFAIGTTLNSGREPVLVSLLSSMYDCEPAPNGRGATDLFSRCPMRVVVGQGANLKVLNFEKVCYLAFPPGPPGPWPDPAKNFTSAVMVGVDAVRVRVTQYGKNVAECDATYQLR